MDLLSSDTLIAAATATNRTGEIVNNGISQAFDYGIAMTVLVLFLFASLALSAWLLRFFTKYMKDSMKFVSDICALAAVMKTQLDTVSNQYNQLIILLNKIDKESK